MLFGISVFLKLRLLASFVWWTCMLLHFYSVLFCISRIPRVLMANWRNDHFLSVMLVTYIHILRAEDAFWPMSWILWKSNGYRNSYRIGFCLGNQVFDLYCLIKGKYWNPWCSVWEIDGSMGGARDLCSRIWSE